MKTICMFVMTLAVLSSPAIARPKTLDLPEAMQAACSTLAEKIQDQEFTTRVAILQAPDGVSEALGFDDFAEALSDFHDKLEMCSENELKTQ